MLHRRHLLTSLLAAGLLPGCALRRRPEPPSVPDGPITLGWRWVPGAAWTYRTVVQRQVGPRVASRAEQWTYRVVDVDRDGVATLGGRLTGFGAGTATEGAWDVHATDRARDTGPREVTLALASDGSLVACSARGFGAALPHRILALRVPALPAARHDEWSLPALARPFADLLPPQEGIDSHATGRLVEVHRREDTVVATVETVGAVRSEAGPALHLAGTATWDTARGALLDRTLTARLAPRAPDPASEPGRLAVQLVRVGWEAGP